MAIELIERADAPIAPATTQPESASLVLMFERLAKDPAVDVAKLERLIEMQERIMRHQAKASFDGAFAEMQGQIPVIIERGHTNNGMYAPLEDIIEKVRPILRANGFYLTFRTEWPDAKTVRVIGILAHKDGHERTSEFLSGADSSGNKNAIQGLASAVSYGQRYTTKDLLNITTRGDDDDGNKAGKKPTEVPAGYQDWLDDLTAVADEGLDKLTAAWKASKAPFRDYCSKHDAETLAKLKAKARGVQS